MGIALKSAQERQTEQRETLRIVESVEHNGKTIGVAEDASGALVLARNVERTVKRLNADGKREPVLDKNGKPTRERVWKRSSALADFADAMDAGLIAG